MAVTPLSRRSLLTGAVLATAGGLAGYVVARGSAAAGAKPLAAAANGYGPPPKDAGQVLTSLAALPAAGAVVAGVVLTRDGSGGVHAVSATCTHQGCTVGAPVGGTVSCPCHGSRFDAATGAVLHGPATRPLPPIAVTVRAGRVVRTG